jgi:hypothetical protein
MIFEINFKRQRINLSLVLYALYLEEVIKIVQKLRGVIVWSLS